MSDQTTPLGRIDLSGLSREEFIVLAQATVAKLKWHYGSVHPLRLEARTRFSAWSYGENITIDIGEREATVTSKHERWSLGAKKRDARNVERFIEAFARTRASMPSEQLRSELAELEGSGVMQQQGPVPVEEPSSWKDALLLFVPKKDYFATPLLIDACVLVYILMVATGVHFFEPTGEDLLKWGANFRPYTLDGEWWRLLTCCFGHIGLIHLLFNMYALAMIGVFLEPMLGRVRLFAAYAITGICASVASMWWHADTVSAGASGAIFGLYGVFLALLLTDLIPKEARKSLLSSIGIFVVYNLVNGLKGNVDNAAHIGGLVSGLILGGSLYFALRSPERTSLAWSTFVAPIVVCGVVGALAVGRLPHDDAAFHRTIEAFQVLEETGIKAFKLPDDATGAEQLTLVNDSCLPAWREAVHLLHGTSGLDLSGELSERRGLYIAYADARLENMELLKEYLENGDTVTSPELDRSFAVLDSALTRLNVE